VAKPLAGRFSVRPQCL